MSWNRAWLPSEPWQVPGLLDRADYDQGSAVKNKARILEALELTWPKNYDH